MKYRMLLICTVWGFYVWVVCVYIFLCSWVYAHIGNHGSESSEDNVSHFLLPFLRQGLTVPQVFFTAPKVSSWTTLASKNTPNPNKALSVSTAAVLR